MEMELNHRLFSSNSCEHADIRSAIQDEQGPRKGNWKDRNPAKEVPIIKEGPNIIRSST